MKFTSLVLYSIVLYGILFGIGISLLQLYPIKYKHKIKQLALITCIENKYRETLLECIQDEIINHYHIRNLYVKNQPIYFQSTEPISSQNNVFSITINPHENNDPNQVLLQSFYNNHSTFSYQVLFPFVSTTPPPSIILKPGQCLIFPSHWSCIIQLQFLDSSLYNYHDTNSVVLWGVLIEWNTSWVIENGACYTWDIQNHINLLYQTSTTANCKTKRFKTIHLCNIKKKQKKNKKKNTKYPENLR